MARRRSKKPSLEDRLAAVAALSAEPDEAKLHQALRVALEDKSPYLVQRAARVVEERGLTALAPELRAAFAQRMEDPVARDQGCIAKTAIAQALSALAEPAEEVFLQGVRHVQMEPSFGRPVDTATQLRVMSAYGLANAGHPDIMPILVDLLVDREDEVRQGAARALGNAGLLEAESVLRLKVRLGDKEPEVTSACLAALLHLAPGRYLPFVVDYLDAAEESTVEAAALALGESRLEAAVEPLWQAYQRCVFRGRTTILLALSLTRRETAFDRLFSLLAEAAPAQANEVLDALAIHRHDAKIRRLVEETLAARPDRGQALRVPAGLKSSR